MTHDPRRPRPFAWLALCLGIACLSACDVAPAPEDVRAELLRKLPATLHERDGWARDIQAAFAAQNLQPSSANLCAVLAVVEQESGYRADPPVPGLARIARAEIDRRAERLRIPTFMVEAGLRFRSADGRTYAQRIQGLRTEQELSALFEEMTRRVPMGRRLFARFNPVRTGGPMQVRIDFAQRHLRDYPYPLDGSVRGEVFSRRGGLYFGIKHLLGYPADYQAPLYRFADFNAGWYASRNAAFQQAAAIAKLEIFFGEARHDWETSDPSARSFPRPYYWHGNEPDLNAAFLFAQLGRPDLTQEWARWVIDTIYNDQPDGVPGNDDGGTMGAWYVFASLGLYPIAGTDRYIVSAPIFEQARITVGGHELVIVAAGAPGRRRARGQRRVAQQPGLLYTSPSPRD